MLYPGALGSALPGWRKPSDPTAAGLSTSRCRCVELRPRCRVAAHADRPAATAAAPAPPPGVQGEEPWRATDMGLAVDTFRQCLLDGLQEEVRAGLARKSRAAAAAAEAGLAF